MQTVTDNLGPQRVMTATPDSNSKLSSLLSQQKQSTSTSPLPSSTEQRSALRNALIAAERALTNDGAIPLILSWLTEVTSKLKEISPQLPAVSSSPYANAIQKLDLGCASKETTSTVPPESVILTGLSPETLITVSEAFRLSGWMCQVLYDGSPYKIVATHRAK